MMTLAEFLLARITEDEDVAREAAAKRPTATGAAVKGVWLNSRYHLTADPGFRLAECEAKRQIVAQSLAWDRDGGSASQGAKATRVALRLLALPYADHPDYREEWKP
jgi:hypothetical protein